MGLSGIGFTELVLILIVFLVLFGSKKLPTIASDLGSAIRDFRRAFSGGQDAAPGEPPAGSKADGGPRN